MKWLLHLILIKCIKYFKTKEKINFIKNTKNKKQNIEYRSTLFGDLYQTKDLTPINKISLLLHLKKHHQNQLMI